MGYNQRPKIQSDSPEALRGEQTYKWIPFVSLRKLNPEVHDSVLEFSKSPEKRLAHPRIRMPILVLSTRNGM